MKIRTCVGMGLVAVGFAAQASTNTVAYWRFENGTAGEEHAVDLDDWYLDSSGNSNHLSSSSDPWRRPAATADRSFATIAQTGATNHLALDFDGDDGLGTYGAGDQMINSYMFTNGWTVECSFKLREINWDVLVGKDGQRGDLGGTVSENPPFVLKIDNSPKNRGRLVCQFIDDDNNITDQAHHNFCFSSDPIELNTWYSVAVSYDGSVLWFHLKAEGWNDYVLMDSWVILGGISLGQYNRSWTVGRGMWNGGATDYMNGLIDEVRISNVALDPVDFINAAVPSEEGAEEGPICQLKDGALSWNSTNSAVYAVEYATNLTSNDWRTVTNGISATPDTNSLSLPTREYDSAFYRVAASNIAWPIPEKTVVLTFDDAVQSHLDMWPHYLRTTGLMPPSSLPLLG